MKVLGEIWAPRFINQPRDRRHIMNSDIFFYDATKLAELIRNREISPVEVVQAHLDRIEAVNPKINAIVSVAEGALEAAKVAEAAVLAGEELGPLHGVPFTVKDSIDTAG